MTNNAIKEKLHDFVEHGDEKLLNMLYAVANEYNGGDDYIFTEKDIAEYERRTASRLKGESKVYSWQEAKRIITGK